MASRFSCAAQRVVLLSAILIAFPAHAIPSFARKYGTSCLTCHTAFPRLNPFGEAFRRNGYRFPGVDSDFIKQETVPLGNDASKKQFPNAVWPAWVPSIPGLAFGANGTVISHPDKNSEAGQADKAQFTLDNLIEEAHIWGGWSIDDSITMWFEATFTPDSANLERAQILFNDLLGPKHAVNLVVGRGVPTLSAFSPHSSYVNDDQFVTIVVPSIYGSGDAGWQLADNFNMVELNSVLAGRLELGVGLNAGSHVESIRATENVYGHAAYKFGGMRLDGEGSTGSTDVQRPWAETALTVHGFASHANSTFTDAASAVQQDVSNAYGVGARLQVDSLELNVEGYLDKHDHATAVAGPDGRAGSVDVKVGWAELSYILYPWLVPAVRVEYVRLEPGNGGVATSWTHIRPGVAFLVRPNVKLTLYGDIEMASGTPDQGGSWSGVGGTVGTVTPTDPNTSIGAQFASLNLGLFFVF
ncbi:MAG TPA: hypothetical protein VFP65_27705 [Anaeromyxobacteraceae bacterium]|nr:hypothetical protein [Anaeromyxobacteraceae bacterium]